MAVQDYGRIMQSGAEFAMIPYNALMQGREYAAQEQRRNALIQQKQQELDAQQAEEAKWQAAVQARDLDTMYAMDPHAAATLEAHWQEQRGQGLSVPTITAKPMAEPSIPALPADYQRYKMEQADPQYAAWARQQSAPRTAPDKPQLIDVTLPDGTTQKQWVRPGQSTGTPIGAPGPADAGKPASESDKKVGVLYGSLVGAENTIQSLGSKVDTSSAIDAALGNAPLISGVTKLGQSDAFRKYEAAALRWSANLLYIKSGATATPEEVRSTYKQFFPQPGDGEDAKAQKAAARQEEMANIRMQYPGVTKGLPIPKSPGGAKALPKVGENRQGYIFIGGDPAKKENWVKTRE